MTQEDLVRVMKSWIAPLFDLSRSNIFAVVHSSQRRNVSGDLKKLGVSVSKVADVETFHHL